MQEQRYNSAKTLFYLHKDGPNVGLFGQGFMLFIDSASPSQVISKAWCYYISDSACFDVKKRVFRHGYQRFV
jgi:hypothetical protein